MRVASQRDPRLYKGRKRKLRPLRSCVKAHRAEAGARLPNPQRRHKAENQKGGLVKARSMAPAWHMSCALLAKLTNALFMVNSAISPQSIGSSVGAKNVPNFCPECGAHSMAWRIPSRDERERAICDQCGYVHYVNPKVVCGCIVRSASGQFLLARRAIEPMMGAWGFPQGFMECGETTRECAARETLEETGFVITDISQLRLLSIYNLPNHVQILYHIDVDDPIVHAQKTKECFEITLFQYDDIPWDHLAFPTVEWALRHIADSSNATPVLHRRIQQRSKVYDPATSAWIVADEESCA